MTNETNALVAHLRGTDTAGDCGYCTYASEAADHIEAQAAIIARLTADRDAWAAESADNLRKLVAATARIAELEAEIVRLSQPAPVEPVAWPRPAQTQPEDVGPDHYDRGRRDMLNAILALNPAADALCAEMHGRTPDPHGKLPFDVLLWVTIVAEQLGIEPKVDPLAKQGGAE